METQGTATVCKRESMATKEAGAWERHQKVIVNNVGRGKLVGAYLVNEIKNCEKRLMFYFENSVY